MVREGVLAASRYSWDAIGEKLLNVLDGLDLGTFAC